MTKSLTARLAAEAEDLRQAARRAEHAAARLAKFETDFAAAKAAGVVSNIAPNGAKAFKAARAAMQAEEDVWRDMLVSDAKQVVRTPSAPNPRRVIEKTYTPKGMACPGQTEGIRRVQAALRALQAEARTTGIPAPKEARFALYAEYDRERAACHEAVVARKEARHD